MMQSYTIWTEGGGHGKTTLATGLAKAHERAGYDVLAVDLDGQKGGLTAHYGFLNDNETEQGANLGDFLANATDEDIHNLIKTNNGVDILPRSKNLRNLEEHIYMVGGPREKEVPDQQLFRLIQDTGIYNEYDVMVVDVPKDIGTATKNGLYATRNVLMPMEPDEKGRLSLEGIIENIHAFESAKALDDFGVVTMVLNKVDDQLGLTNTVREIMEENTEVYAEHGYEFPVSPIEIADHKSLFKEAMYAHTDPFTYYNEEKERQYATDRESLHRLDLLGEYVMYMLTSQDPTVDTKGRKPTEEEINRRPPHEELFDTVDAENEENADESMSNPA